MIIILTVIIVLVLIYKYAWPSQRYWENKNLPAYKIKMFMPMKNVINDMSDIYQKMKVEGHRIVGIYLTWDNVLFFSDYQLFSTFPMQNKNLYKYKVNSDKLFDLVLHSANDLVTMLQEVTKSNKSDNEFIFHDLVTKYTTNVITSLIFGFESVEFQVLNTKNKFNQSKMRDMTLVAGKFTITTFVKQIVIDYLPKYLPKLAKKFKFTAYDSTAHNFFVKTIQEALEYRNQKQNTMLRDDFLQVLLDAENADGEKITMCIEEIAEHVMSFYVTEVETAAVLISYSLIEIKRNSSVESKLRCEICSALERHNYTLSLQALDGMFYLDLVVKETIRMYPANPIIWSKTTENYSIHNLDNAEFEKDTKLAISLLAIQRDAENYKDPEIFNPERSQNIEINQLLSNLLKKTENCFIFGGDNKTLQFQQCKIALALILWNFDYEINKIKYPLELDAPNDVLICKDKLSFKFSPLITSL